MQRHFPALVLACFLIVLPCESFTDQVTVIHSRTVIPSLVSVSLLSTSVLPSIDHDDKNNKVLPVVANIIKPGTSFRTTETGELSVCSFNMLAPAYHWIGHAEEESKKEQDRKDRIPNSIAMAKAANADVLLLQEVEGGDLFEPRLKQLLQEPMVGGLEGHDDYVLTALHPNRPGDVVGLAVAWRSKKHALLSSEGFRRGMVVQLEELDSGSTFCVGNVHLPAKPADIEGRLKTMATTIRKVDGCESPIRCTPLDGAIIIGGDFNCDQDSPTVHLLKTGSSMHGTVKDRNYKTKISKDEAARMRHSHRFKDIYADNLRDEAAPITVSLHGRGPGCMDHILYANGGPAAMAKSLSAARNNNAAIAGGIWESKRKLRRVHAQARDSGIGMALPSPLRVECVLATVDPAKPDRTKLILSGLPQFDKGFPSDHLPIGALFVPTEDCGQLAIKSELKSSFSGDTHVKPGGLGWNARRRQESYHKSVLVRKRHNAILRTISEWMISRGAVEVIRDQPLYKWKWTTDIKKLSKKMRAPDLCCVIGKSLVIVEVTVANKPDMIRREKELKYYDLSAVLKEAPAILEAGLVVPEPFIIVMGENGEIPENTQKCLDDIARLSSEPSIPVDPIEGKRIALQLSRVSIEHNIHFRT